VTHPHVARRRWPSSYLASVGLEKGAMVGLYSINRPEWVIAEQGSNYQALVTVPLYDTLGAEAIEFIINQTEMTIVFTTSDKLKNLTNIAKKLPTLKRVVIMDGATPELVKQGSDAGFEVIGFADAEKVRPGGKLCGGAGSIVLPLLPKTSAPHAG